jgi:hypothetical protein
MEVRCKGILEDGRPCNRRLFDGSPGFDIITGEPKILRLKCPKCGAMNLISSEIFEKVVVRVKE